MAKMRFQAKHLDGRMIKGEVEAASIQQARVKLKAMKMEPVSIQDPRHGSETDFFSQLLVQRVPEKELKVFIRQLAVLWEAGVPIEQALGILISTTKDKTLKLALVDILKDLQAGERIPEAFQKHRNIFDNFFVSLLRAGQTSPMDRILNRLAEHIEKSAKLKNKVKSAMWYPAGIVLFTIAAVCVIMIYVVPQFESLYANSNAEPPLLTQLVSNASKWMAQYWYLVLGGVIGLPVFLMAYYRSDNGRKNFDAIFLSLPVFGPLVQKAAVANFSRTLSTLLSSKVDVIQALDISAKTSGNYVVETAIMRAKKALSEGKPMSLPLRQEKVIPDMVSQMIAIGETAGEVDKMLEKIADFFEDETEAMVGALTSIIEPVLMVFIGLVVAVLVIAIYLPVFNMASLVSGGS